MQKTKARLLATLLMLAAATAFAATDYDKPTAETGGLLSTSAYGSAIAQHEEAVRVAEEKTGEASLQTAKALFNLASLVHDQGNYARAEQLYQRSLSILERSLEPDHPAIANCLNSLAMIYKAQGQYATAESLYRRSLAIEENAHGAEHPDVAVSLNNLAQLYRALGISAKADPLYRRSLAILEKTRGPAHPTTLMVRENMAHRSGKVIKVVETAPSKEGDRSTASGKQQAGRAAAASPNPSVVQAEARVKALAEAKALTAARAQAPAKAQAEADAKALGAARPQSEKEALASAAITFAPSAGEMDQIALIDLAGTAAAVVAPALPSARVAPALSVAAPIGGPVGDLIAASSDWVKNTPEQHYFIQLSACEPSERAALESHLADARRQLDPQQVRAYRSALSGRDRIAFIYGDYATEAAGRKAMAQLPPSFRKFQPFLRQVGKVR